MNQIIFPGKNRARLPNLTSIRFFLAFLVLIWHVSLFSENRGFPTCNYLTVFQKGTEAVYAFFALSGFLIIKQLFEEKTNTNTIDLRAFYLRRALRIFPLYYLVLSFGFLYYNFILPFFGFYFESNYNLLNGILLSISFFSNIFSSYSPGGILEVLWSIGVEEQFYLLIAPLFFLLPVKRLTLFLGAFTFFYFLLYFSDAFMFLREFRMLFFYFSFGGFCSIFLNRNRIQFLIKKIRLFILITLLLYFTTFLFKNNLNEVSYQLFTMLLFGTSILALSQKPLPIFENKAMIYLGKISYGIYMYHSIVLQFVGLIYLKFISKLELNSVLGVVIINLLVLVLTIIISHFSYRYYESYFLNFKYRIKAKSVG